MTEEELFEVFEMFLKNVCDDFDSEWGVYPETEYQGQSLYEHYLEDKIRIKEKLTSIIGSK